MEKKKESGISDLNEVESLWWVNTVNNNNKNLND